jgi:hypothetical protein
LKLEKRPVFLTEWATSRNIISRGKNTADELTGSYSLRHDIEKSYPSRECPWDKKVIDGLEDLAALVAAIYKKYKSKNLVALTSTASNKDLQLALEAELELWLYDHTASVYEGLAELSRLAEEISASTPAKEQLEKANAVLAKTANFMAQVHNKLKLAESRQDIYKEIEALAATDKLMSRCWRDLHTTLDGRISSEGDPHGLQEIISTLRIARVTTRVLRELLTLAGFKDERSKGLEESLNVLQATLDDTEKVDPATRTMFAATNSKPDIATLLTLAKGQPLDDFIEAFPSVRKLVLEIAARCEQVLRTHGIERKKEQARVLEVPRYIMMWDIIGSTNYESRDPLESLIIDANQRIKDTFSDRIMDFHAESKDDGNGFICESFTDVLAAFQILNEVFRGYRFRAGCDVNLQGQLNYYPQSKTLGGRAYEYTARVMAFYKEVSAYPARWSNGPVPPEEPDTSYMVVSEFAERYAQADNTWPASGTFIINQLKGRYKARIKASLPVSLSILQPVDFKPKGLEDTGSPIKQPELL